MATSGIDPLLNVSLFDWWDRFSALTWLYYGVARSCGQGIAPNPLINFTQNGAGVNRRGQKKHQRKQRRTNRVQLK